MKILINRYYLFIVTKIKQILTKDTKTECNEVKKKMDGYQKVILSATFGLVIGLLSAHDSLKTYNQYKGELNGQKVVYFEKKFPDRNTLRVMDGETVYVMQDYKGAASITDPNFSEQSLERIIIQNSSKKEIFDASRTNKELSQLSNEQIFRKANQCYNNIRAQIREQVKAEYQNSVDKLPQMERR